MTEEPIAVIASSILRYLSIRPNAADTASGIAEWWVDEPFATLDLVEAALHLLEARHEVETVKKGRQPFQAGYPHVYP
jgi:hypothetical protein